MTPAADVPQGGPARPGAELRRQQLLLQSMVRHGEFTALRAWLKPVCGIASREASSGDLALRGWQAHMATVHAGAERALAAAFPTVRALMGEESFAAMARAFWHAHPPRRGDLAWLGEDLPGFIQASGQLAAEPYLADSARLDWALARCEAAADATVDMASLNLLAETPPSRLRLQLPPGTRLLRSAHPIVAIWRAHHEAPPDGADPFAPVRAAFAQGRGECALVWREGWRARVRTVDAPAAAFVEATLAASATDSLADAMDAAGLSWRFDEWLVDAVRSGLVSGLHRLD